MTVKQYGYVKSGQHLTSGIDWYTLYTDVNIIQAGSPGAGPLVAVNGMAADLPISVCSSQIALDKLIEVIGTRGQMVIMGAPYWQEDAPFPNIGSPGFTATDKYVLKFAIEHTDSWINKTQGPTAAVGDPWSSKYDAIPGLIDSIAQSLGTGHTLYPGTLNSTLIEWRNNANQTASAGGFVGFTTGNNANTRVTVLAGLG